MILSTTQRLALAFGVFVVLSAAQGFLMSANLAFLAGKSTLASTKPVDGVHNARGAWSVYGDAKSFLRNAMEMTRPEDSAVALAKFEVLVARLNDHLDQLAATAISPAALLDAQIVKTGVGRWVGNARILLGAAPATSIPSPHAMAKLDRSINETLNELVSLTLNDAASARQDVKTSAIWMGRLNLLIVLIGVLAGTTLAVFSSRSVTRPIRRIGETLRELANGNKDIDIPFVDRRDEVGDTARAAKSFRDNIIRMELIEAEKRQAELKADHHIRFLAHHDVLTDLPNRAFFTEKLDAAVARLERYNEPFNVLVLDLDKFKSVNDTLGHPAGDQLLREAAQRLRSSLRETDVLARLGGDEFAIIQTHDTDQRESAIGLSTRIINMLSAPYELDGSQVTVGTSIGIAMAPDDAGSGADLLKMADIALYETKSAGRNSFRFFEPAMLKGMDDRRRLEAELRTGIQRHEFELHYQPLVDIKTRRQKGFEALLRWRNPDRGWMLPDQFIPLAEETGLIAPLGAWVLQQACMDAARWPSHIKVAVNLSPIQLARPDLLEIVLCALVELSLEPERLELEITETALFNHSVDCVRLIRQLKHLGVSISLDDFGTGYSSLSYLTMFPFDKIKIDRSFTANMTTRAACAAIVAAVLALGHNLNVETVAEGVETEEQFEILRATGITQAQGYLFGRPCPASALIFDSALPHDLVESAA